MQRRLRQAADALEQALSICTRAQHSGEAPPKNVAEIHSELRKATQSLERASALPMFDESEESEPPPYQTMKERREARKEARQKRRERAQRRARAKTGWER